MFTNVTIADEHTQLGVPKHEPVTLKFRAFDPARVLIDEQLILRNLTSALQTKSRLPLKNNRGPIELVGLRTILDQGQSQIVFQYVNVERSPSGNEYGQLLSIPVTYQVERGNDDITVRLLPPEKADFTTRRLMLSFLTSLKLGPVDELFADFSAVLDAVPTLKLRLSFLAKGEAIANFKPESVIGNFERLLGRHAYGYNEERVYDLKRDNVFSYRIGQERVPLKVAAFSYRDGTKIVYEAKLPYQLAGDGTSEGYDLPSTIKSDIDHILND